MSKIVDVLNKPRHQHKTKIDNPFHEEIAKTYLKTSARRHDKKKPAATSEIMPWLLAAIALLLALILFITKSNFDVKIRVLTHAPFTAKEISAGDSVDLLQGEMVFLKGNILNRETVRSAFFFGDARPASSAAEGEIVLCNSKGYGWASYRIELKNPVNLNGLSLRYSARGEMGGERLVLIIVDSDNRAYRVEDDLATRLTKEWQDYALDFKPVNNELDLAGISAIRFEFGSSTAGNSENAKIFLKDIYAAKPKRIRWL